MIFFHDIYGNKKEKIRKKQQFFLETFPANHYSITVMRGEELRKFLREKTNAELVDLMNDALWV